MADEELAKEPAEYMKDKKSLVQLLAEWSGIEFVDAAKGFAVVLSSDFAVMDINHIPH